MVPFTAASVSAILLAVSLILAGRPGYLREGSLRKVLWLEVCAISSEEARKLVPVSLGLCFDLGLFLKEMESEELHNYLRSI